MSAMPAPVVSSTGQDRLAAAYQLQIRLRGIRPHISRRLLVQGDTSLAVLHHIFQVVMGWENWHLHSFTIQGKEYGISYAGGLGFCDNAARIHLGDFSWQVGDQFAYTYDFGDYWQHQVRIEDVLPCTSVPNSAVCLSGRRACPQEEVGGPRGYDQRTTDQFSWSCEALDRLLAGENISEDDVPSWFWTYRPEHFDKELVNDRLAKVDDLKGNTDFLYAQGGYNWFFAPESR